MKSSLEVQLLGDTVHEKHIYLFLLYFVRHVMQQNLCIDSIDCLVQKVGEIGFEGESDAIISWTILSHEGIGSKNLRYYKNREPGTVVTLCVDGYCMLRIHCAYTIEEIRSSGIKNISVLLEISSFGENLIPNEDVIYIKGLL